MNGIIAEKNKKNGIVFWTVKDAKTSAVLSVGVTAVEAVSNYETRLANEQIARELGVSLKDMDI